MCHGRGSNPHVLRHTVLSRACLPIPTPWQYSAIVPDAIYAILGSVDITYTRKHNSRSTRISIAIKNGAVVVTAPKLIPKLIIDAFVSKNREWIEKNLQKSAKKLSVETTDSVLVFGKTYKKIILDREAQSKAPKPVEITGTKIVITPVSQTLESTKKTLDRWLKQTAEKYIVPRTHQLGTKMNTKFASIALKQQSTRWGSCSSRGNLNFNWRLVHYPTAIIDYVIIHELAHRTHMHHQASFWALVAKYDPNYKQHINWLKRYGTTVE